MSMSILHTFHFAIMSLHFQNETNTNFVHISLFRHVLNIFIECIHNVNNSLYIALFHAFKDLGDNFVKYD